MNQTVTGAKLQELRESVGLSRRDAARSIPCDITTYGAWERGESQPTNLALRACLARTVSRWTKVATAAKSAEVSA
jgi:Helix-turn-helix.